MVLKIITSVRSFLGSGIIQCYFTHRQYAWQAWGFLLMLMVLLSVNVWGAVYWANVLNDFGDMLENKTTNDLFMQIVWKTLFVWVIVFGITDNGTYLVRQYLALYWRRQARVWYEERAEAHPRKVAHTGQRIIDTTSLVIEKMLDLALSGYRAIIALFVFVPMIVTLSPPIDQALYRLTLRVFDFGIYIPWLVVWLLVLTFIVETLVSHYLGRPLKDLEASKQKTTARTRSQADRAHTNNRTSRLFPILRDNHLRKRTRLAIRLLFKREHRQLLKQFRLTLGRSGYSIFYSIWPLLIFGYFVAVFASISLGVMQKMIAVMNEVHRSLGVIPDSWQTIKEIQGGLKLLHDIEK